MQNISLAKNYLKQLVSCPCNGFAMLQRIINWWIYYYVIIG